MEKAPTKKRNRMRDVGNKVRNVNKAMHNAPSAQKAPQGSSATTASPAIAEPPPAVKTEADAEPSDTSPAAGVATSPNPIAEMPPAAPAQTEGGSLHSPHLTVSSRKSFEFGEEETAQREELIRETHPAPVRQPRRSSKRMSRVLSLSGSSLTLETKSPAELRRASSLTARMGHGVPVFPAVDSSPSTPTMLLAPEGRRRLSSTTVFDRDAEMDQVDSLASPENDLVGLLDALAASFTDTDFLKADYEPSRDELYPKFHTLHTLYIATERALQDGQKLAARVRKGIEVKSSQRSHAENAVAEHLQVNNEMKALLAKQAEDLQRAHASAEERIIEAERTVRKAKESQEAERAYWKNRITETKAVMEKQKEEFEMEQRYMLEQVKNGASSEIQAVTGQLEDEYTKVRNLKINLEAKTTQVGQLKEKIDAMETAKRGLLEQLSEVNDELAAQRSQAQGEVLELNIMLQEAQSTTQEIAGRLQHALLSAEANEAEVADLRSMLESSRAMEEQLSGKLQGDATEREDLENQLEYHLQKVKELEDQLRTQEDLEKELRVKANLMDALAKQFGLISIRHGYTALFMHMIRKQRLRSETQYNTYLTKSKQEISRLETEIKLGEARTKQLLAHSEDLKQKLESDAGGLHKRIEKQGDEIQQKKVAIEDLKTALEAQKRKLREVQGNREEKRNQAKLVAGESERVGIEFLTVFRKFVELFKRKFRMKKLNLAELKVAFGSKVPVPIQIFRIGSNFSKSLANLLEIERTLSKLRQAQTITTIGERLRLKRENRRLARMKHHETVRQQLELEKANLTKREAAAAEVKNDLKQAITEIYNTASVPSVQEALTEGGDNPPCPETIADEHFKQQQLAFLGVGQRATSTVTEKMTPIGKEMRGLDVQRSRMAAEMMVSGQWVYPQEKTLLTESERQEWNASLAQASPSQASVGARPDSATTRPDSATSLPQSYPAHEMRTQSAPRRSLLHPALATYATEEGGGGGGGQLGGVGSRGKKLPQNSLSCFGLKNSPPPFTAMQVQAVLPRKQPRPHSTIAANNNIIQRAKREAEAQVTLSMKSYTTPVLLVGSLQGTQATHPKQIVSNMLDPSGTAVPKFDPIASRRPSGALCTTRHTHASNGILGVGPVGVDHMVKKVQTPPPPVALSHDTLCAIGGARRPSSAQVEMQKKKVVMPKQPAMMVVNSR